ncbi:MAG: hypothetical protein IJL00_04910 [Clostridia bacterium]|nr:hypothetical protein [Clostridia bacterium]
MAKAKKKQTPAPVPVPSEAKRFTKRAILFAEPYKFRSALVDALLDDDKTYTLEEVDALIEQYMKRKVR